MEMEKLRAAIPGMRVVTEGNFGGGSGLYICLIYYITGVCRLRSQSIFL